MIRIVRLPYLPWKTGLAGTHFGKSVEVADDKVNSLRHVECTFAVQKDVINILFLYSNLELFI